MILTIKSPIYSHEELLALFWDSNLVQKIWMVLISIPNPMPV